MKPTLLTLSFLLLAFTTNLSQGNEQVKDSNGNPIFPGGRYYIKPPIFGAAGGGVRLGRARNSECPVTVLQDYSEVVNGLEVKFNIAAEISIPEIYTGTKLDVSFERTPKCAESSKWVVVVDDDFPKPWVGIGGVDDHPGKHVINGTFEIQKYGLLGERSIYKLVFCPFISVDFRCVDIGRYNDKNGRRLVLVYHQNEEPYALEFVDARDNGKIRSLV